MTRLWRAALKAQSKADAESDAESEPECQVVEEHAQRGPDAQAEADAQGEDGNAQLLGGLGVLFLYGATTVCAADCTDRRCSFSVGMG